MNLDLQYRLARPEDSAIIAKLMVQAIGDMANHLVSKEKAFDAKAVFKYFIQQKENLYSYENTIICEENNKVVGSINGYDGAKFMQLRQPFINYLKEHYDFNQMIEPETGAGEFYLDTVSVLPDKQSLGIGSVLIQKMIQYASEKGHQKIGLLVDKKNPKAKKLYENLGFRKLDEIYLLGNKYDHLVFEL